MVHYIRFLKVPQVQLEDKGLIKRISAVLTVTTDLGEIQYPDDLELTVRLVHAKHPKNTIESWHVPWRGGSLVSKLNVKHKSRVSLDAVRLHITEGTDDSLARTWQIPEIVDVWSSSFRLDANCSAPDYVERRLRLDEDTFVNIWEATGESIARHIWDGALGCLELYKRTLLLNDAVIKMPLFHQLLTDSAHKGIKVVELGSGCGVAGIGLAQIVPNVNVLLTDLEEAQGIISKNINYTSLSKGSSLHQELLDWSEPLAESEAHKNVDLLIVCECIYNADSCPTLISILQQFIDRSPAVKLLVITKRRHDSETVFFELMEEAGIQILEQCFVFLPHHFSDMDSERPQAEIYLYGAQKDVSSKSELL